jgi:hypothetical protein
MTPRIPAFALLGVLAISACDFATRSGGGTEGVGLSGTLLLPDGSPAAGKKVLAFAANDFGVTLSRVAAGTGIIAPIAVDSAITDAHGIFRLTRLDSGTYNLAPLPEAGDSALGWFRTGVAYLGGSMQLERDTLRGSGNVLMQVLDGDRVLPGAVCFVAGSPYRATTDNQGACLVRGLPPGNYRLWVAYSGNRVAESTEEAYVESGLNSNCGAVDVETAGWPVNPTE